MPLERDAILLDNLKGTLALLPARRAVVRRAETLLAELNPSGAIRGAIQSLPSLATIPNAFYRVGVVLFCPLAVFAAMALELRREWVGGASATSCRTRWAAC